MQNNLKIMNGNFKFLCIFIYYSFFLEIVYYRMKRNPKLLFSGITVATTLVKRWSCLGWILSFRE
jgi:hypothetical protein